jgi:hypothetical protein
MSPIAQLTFRSLTSLEMRDVLMRLGLTVVLLVLALRIGG